MKPGGEGEHTLRSNGDGWINGLLTGAEKFLNAVLWSDTPSSSSSSTSYSMSSDEKGGNGSLAISTTRNDELNQEFDPQTGSSPVEVAREYMNSLPEKNCAKVFKRGYESSSLGVPSETTKRVKLMLIEGSLNLPKFKQLDVNSTVQSSYQSQASIGANDTPILTAIPLNPADLHISKSYTSDSKGHHNTDQLNNAWVPYATCAMGVPEIQPRGCFPSTEMCSTQKLVLHDEGTISTPSTSRRGRGGRTGRGRGRSGAGNEVARNSTCDKPYNDGTEGSPKKSPTPRPRRGRGRGRGAKPS